MRVTCNECLAVATIGTIGEGSTVCPRCGKALQQNETEVSSRTLSTNTESYPSAPPTATLVRPLPDYIGPYRVLKVIAQGGFGIVYLAFDEQLSCEVAIKLPRTHQDARTSEMMLQEARTLAKLRHPNIVRVLAANQTAEGDCYIVMDWIEGQTLRERIAAKTLSIEQSVSIIAQLADALHTAHRMGLVHRDVKPSNVLMDREGTPFVTDFGLAIDDVVQREHRDEFAGTVAYMSPEQIRAESQYLDGRTDVWALGVMLYEMLAGRRPFEGSREQVSDEIRHREPKPLCLLNDQVPESLGEIVKRCLAKDISQRTETAARLRDALRLELAARSDRQAVGGLSRSSGAAARWVAGGVVASVAAIAGLMFVFDKTPLEKDPLAPAVMADTRESSIVDARVTDVRPEPAFGILVPGRWNKLLSQPPQKLVWPVQSTGSMMNHEPELEQLTLILNGTARLHMATIDSPKFRVTLTVQQPSWPGDVAIYYGWKKTATGFECEQVSLHSAVNRNGETVFTMARHLERYRPDYTLFESVGLSSTPLPQPGKTRKDWMLTFENNRLASASWDGKALPKMIPDDYLAGPIGAAGDLGISLSDTSATISQFRVFYE